MSRRSDAERRKLIVDRQKNSFVWKFIHMLGSLQLALLLLATIALACAVATFYESRFDTAVAQTYIYKAPWFIFWLAVLCINLFAVTLTRWPWQKKHTGFIITHYGIILLLCGAVVGSKFGFEGNVRLNTTEPPINRITTSRSILQIAAPNNAGLYVLPFDASVIRPSASRPEKLSVPETNWQIVITETSDDLFEESVLEAQPQGSPGIHLRLTSVTAGQSFDAILLLDPVAPAMAQTDLFGMAKIRLRDELPKKSERKFHEIQMVFSKFAPVIRVQEQKQDDTSPQNLSQTDQAEKNPITSGIALHLSPDGKNLTIQSPGNSSATYKVSDLLGKSISVNSDSGPATLEVLETWSDLKIKDGKPTNASDTNNNPAILARISFQRSETLIPTDASLALDATIQTPNKNNDAPKIDFVISRNGHATASGNAGIGDSFATGWNDWQAELINILPSAKIATRIRPANPAIRSEASGIPGFLAHLEIPGAPPGPDTWVRSGDLTTLPLDYRNLRIGYGLELRQVPFSIHLLKFEVPRYEGTQNPSNFISTVEFKDLATGETKTDIAKMNSPASWPGGFWPITSGLNYKFSQAEWNPQDLNETTLQVLYDPGWLLKWVGSLAICVGIAIMFYWKPGGSKKTTKD
ncbi:MAG: cytochrome C biogenesis protein ResB [Chthoniobacterales bacterium]